MSVKKSDVLVKRSIDRGMVTFEAELKLKNENVVKKKKIADHEMQEVTDIMFENLQQSIIAYIYGDLIDPLNAIMKIVTQDVITKKDKEKILEHRQLLQDIIFGNEREKTEEEKAQSIIQLLN